MTTLSDNAAMVFFDIDGTLLNKAHQIPASASAAIHELQKNGHLAFLNTGRCFSSIQPRILEIGFDGIVAACGTWIQFRGEQLLNHTIEPDLIARLITVLKENQIEVWFEGPSHVYVENLGPERSIERFLSYFDDLPEALADWQQEPIVANKMSYLQQPGGSLERCMPFLSGHFDVIKHLPEHGEIVPKGFSKATGIQFMMECLNVHRSRTYAFGDSLNDVDMLSFAAHGIAMAGSRTRVLAVSDHVTASPEDHGISEGLRHYGLI